ncbi:MAG: hypothetical protein H7Z14_01755 [Anaerolineae bacterium]|nr:hypothetical protein [Phycisphaerae bacterium]
MASGAPKTIEQFVDEMDRVLTGDLDVDLAILERICETVWNETDTRTSP